MNPPKNRPAAYTAVTGRDFAQAVRHLARKHSAHMTAQLLGYSHQEYLELDLARLGIEVRFQPKSPLYTLDGHSLTIEQHAARIGAHVRTLYKRIERWGLCDRVVTTPLADVAMRAHNRRKTA